MPVFYRMLNGDLSLKAPAAEQESEPVSKGNFDPSTAVPVEASPTPKMNAKKFLDAK